MRAALSTDHALLVAEWEAWLRRKRYAPTTVRDYVRVARGLLAAHPGVPVEAFTAEHLERHLAPLSAGSFVADLERLRAFFTWLWKSKRLVRHNPCADVEPPEVPDAVRPAVLPDQFRALCRAAPCLEALVFLHLLYHSGLRVNEARNVRVGDLDLERRILRVRAGKGTRRSGPRERLTVIAPESVPVLRLWLWRAVRLHPDLWLLGDGRHRRSRHVLDAWWAACRSGAGLPPEVTPHSLRHGFVKKLKRLGVSIDIVANLVGHKDMEVTRKVYGPPTIEEMRDIVERAAGKAGDLPNRGG